MRLISPQIEALQQPFEFLHADRLRGRASIARPRKFLRFQSLVPQAKAIAVPVQRLDLVALAIDENVQGAAEWVQLQFLLNQRGEATDRFPEIDRLPAQIDLFDVAAGMHQRAPCAARPSAASHSGAGSSDSSIRMPDPSTKVQPVNRCARTGSSTRSATNAFGRLVPTATADIAFNFRCQ